MGSSIEASSSHPDRSTPRNGAIDTGQVRTLWTLPPYLLYASGPVIYRYLTVTLLLSPLLFYTFTSFPLIISHTIFYEHRLASMRATVSSTFSPAKLCILGYGSASGGISRITTRSFASSGSQLATWGFVGLGRMGEVFLWLPELNRCQMLVAWNEQRIWSTCPY